MDDASAVPSSVGSPVMMLPPLRMKFGQSSKKSPFHSNEDRVIVVPDLCRQVGEDSKFMSSVALVVVCDGHGGAKCVEHLSRSFPGDLFRASKALLTSSAFPSRERQPGVRISDLGLALAQGFQEAENVWMHIARRSGDSSGACMTAVVIRGRSVAVANVGDCRAVLRMCDGTLKVLTMEHRCSVPSERTRIRNAGGFIKDNRVLGILEPTRTIGDLDEKTKPGVVVATPDIMEVEVDMFPTEVQSGHHHASSKRTSSASGTSRSGAAASASARAHSPVPTAVGDRATSLCVLVIASDGVWDFLSNEAVLGLVCEVLVSTRSADKAASAVCKAAAAHGSQDDISTAVVWFS